MNHIGFCMAEFHPETCVNCPTRDECVERFSSENAPMDWVARVRWKIQRRAIEDLRANNARLVDDNLAMRDEINRLEGKLHEAKALAREERDARICALALLDRVYKKLDVVIRSISRESHNYENQS